MKVYTDRWIAYALSWPHPHCGGDLEDETCKVACLNCIYWWKAISVILKTKGKSSRYFIFNTREDNKNVKTSFLLF